MFSITTLRIPRPLPQTRRSFIPGQLAIHFPQPNIHSAPKLLDRLIHMPLHIPSKTPYNKWPSLLCTNIASKIHRTSSGSKKPPKASNNNPLLLKAKKMQKVPQIISIESQRSAMKSSSKTFPVTNCAPKEPSSRNSSYPN